MLGNTATCTNVRPGLVLAVANWYRDAFEMRKPPFAAAGMLAQIIELHLLGMPLPTHGAMAESVGCTVWAIDTALNVALGREVITEKARVIKGNVAGRVSSIKQNFYVPCGELLLLTSKIPKNPLK